MKISGKHQFLDESSTVLQVDPALAQAMGITNSTLLYAAALVYEDPNSSRGRKLTLIGSPFPEQCWRRLIRVAICLDTKHGGLSKTLSALNALELHCRYIEEMAGVRLDKKAKLHVAGQPIGIPTAEPRDHILLPSVLLVLELPNSSSTPLHVELGKLFDEESRDQSRARELLNEELHRRLNQPTSKQASGEEENRTRVHWISPMTVLYQLCNPHDPKADRVRVTGDKDGSMSITLLPWRRFLWAKRRSPDLPRNKDPERDGTRILAVSAIDSDERVICWHFYDHAQYLVVEFDMVVPAFGLEQIWWEYIYDSVHEARGWIISSYSSSRFESSWSTLRSVALFPLPEKQPEQDEHRKRRAQDEAVRRIVGCFRDLQGNSSHSKRFEKLLATLGEARKTIGPQILPTEEYRAKWRARNDTDKSRLERVVVWDPEANGTGRRYSPGLFARNPFNFTMPLGLKSLEVLYGNEAPARQRLADLVVERLMQGPGENFAIVGAHRTGKTTVLNLVCDRLSKHWGNERKLLPVRINASVTPPHMILLEIAEKLQEAFEGKAEALSILSNAASHTMEFARRLLLSSTMSTALPWGTIEIKGADLLNKDVGGANLGSLLARVESEKRDAMPEFLKLALRELSQALLAAGDMRLLIVIDELSDLTLWGDPRIFAVWRHSIESSDFKNLSWLISTSRPIDETTRYSPITNVLRELNVGPLDADEAEILIDAFSVAGWREEKERGRQVVSSGTLRPVITQPARHFLKEVTRGGLINA